MNTQMRMPRGRTQMSYLGQCPENEIPPHMQRGPMPCFDNCSKMDGHCGMGANEFKPPIMNTDSQPPPAKKKRRTSNAMSAAAQPSSVPAMQDLCPPPLSGYGDTVVASNPFDDTPTMPPSASHMNPMNHVNKQMGVSPCMSPAAQPMMGSRSPCHITGSPMMGSRSPCHITGSPVSCGPPIGSPINCGPPMGNCSPMSGSGSCGPVGSPHTNCNSRQMNRSPLMGPPISTNSVMNNSPMMSMNPSPSSLGSPMSSTITSNIRGNSPLDCGLGINSVGSQKGSPMSVMGSHGINNMNCGSPMGSPSNVPLNNCNTNNMMGSPLTSPLSNVPCSISNAGNSTDLNMNLNNAVSRSPHRGLPPTSISGSMMCNSSLQGPMPGSNGPLNGPMSMNFNPNSSVMNMNMKADMNMSDIALRQTCGPGHLPVKPNNGPGACGMPVNNSPCARPSQMVGMHCGPMNSPHCSPMMSNQCGPSMNHGPCIGNGIGRSPCPPNMGMCIPFDNMNPQYRPMMNRSPFPRNVGNIPYGPNSMNSPMNGPPHGPMNGLPVHVNSPMCSPMNGPNMNSMFGPSELHNLPNCGPNNNLNSRHCLGNQSPLPPSLNNVQCMNPSNMNQYPPTQPPSSMYNSPCSPFDTNNSRCSPNLHFNPNNMNLNSNYYRSPGMNNAGSGLCPPNMQPSVIGPNANDILGMADCSVNNEAISAKNDSAIDSDIASMVCNITNDTSDDLNLLEDELLRDIKSDEPQHQQQQQQQQCKLMKDFGSDLLLKDDMVSKDEELDVKPIETDLDVKVSNDKLQHNMGILDSSDLSTSSPDQITSTGSSITTTILSSTTCTSTSSSTHLTATNVTAVDADATVENNDVNSCGSNNVASVKSSDSVNHDDEFASKNESCKANIDNETLSNTSIHSNGNAVVENDGLALDDIIAEDKIKNEPSEDKMLDGDFHNTGENNKMLCEDKGNTNNTAEIPTRSINASSADSDLVGLVPDDSKDSCEVAAATASLLKMENNELFDNGASSESNLGADGSFEKNNCAVSVSGIAPGGNGFSGPNALQRNGPPPGFNLPTTNDMVSDNIISNSTSCITDVLCHSPTLPNVNGSGMPPNSMNHVMNFPGGDMRKVYPVNKSKVFDSQNPNAPPIYNCGKCQKGINDDDQAILCESGCHFWYHRTCSGLIEIAYQLLTREIYAEWACDTCLSTKNIPLVKYKS